MAKYVLVYQVSDYPENGGGMYAEDFEPSCERDMHNRVNELANEYKDAFKVVYAGYMTSMYEYEPITQVTEYREKRI